ncbi:MAG: helix-turn-helix transcriptional regulator, partial [Nevskia sp.]|nr:helix-turn-helix transcriptional regulator [Nevskia sp.]
LPPRTLQYRLEQLGLSFREVLDQVRCAHAEQLLRNPRICLAEVAFLLGYSDQANFQHAFKRWLGVSPGEYRAARLRSGGRVVVQASGGQIKGMVSRLLRR